MNPNCLYDEPGDWTWVTAVLGEAANQSNPRVIFWWPPFAASFIKIQLYIFFFFFLIILITDRHAKVKTTSFNLDFRIKFLLLLSESRSWNVKLLWRMEKCLKLCWRLKRNSTHLHRNSRFVLILLWITQTGEKEVTIKLQGHVFKSYQGHLNPRVDSPQFAAVLLLLWRIHNRGGRPVVQLGGFKDIACSFLERYSPHPIENLLKWDL